MNIIKDEPIPDAKIGRHSDLPELIAMQEGDCIVFDIEKSKKVRAAVAYLTRTIGAKFVTRTVSNKDTNKEEFKVWRKS